MVFIIIINLFITDKYTKLMDINKYTFDVDIKLKKPQIKKIIETLYEVKVIDINTYRLPRKRKNFGNLKNYSLCLKRAIVSISKNQKINIINNL
uniref:Large ribosomal subunit protein uL23c n=1 Tax=Dichotomosiphon tuberosus TaxID=118263 RepID=A0A386AWY9_9CHLO|nr:ribosomal protein L23 [Dichotomosiphon tuberosus]